VFEAGYLCRCLSISTHIAHMVTCLSLVRHPITGHVTHLHPQSESLRGEGDERRDRWERERDRNRTGERDAGGHVRIGQDWSDYWPIGRDWSDWSKRKDPGNDEVPISSSFVDFRQRPLSLARPWKLELQVKGPSHPSSRTPIHSENQAVRKQEWTSCTPNSNSRKSPL
jgi:hypothetical protein